MKVRHKQVETWMVGMVERRLSNFDYQGKLDRQHYSFCKTGVVSPFPVYHHLLFCYNRTGRKLQVKVGCSLLFQWQLRRNPGRITYLSEMLACDLSGHSRFLKSRDRFEERLQKLQDGFFPEYTEKLVQDPLLLQGMHALLQGHELSPEEFSNKQLSDLNLVMKQRGALYGEVAELRHGAKKVFTSSEFLDFMADQIPEEASQVSSGSFTLNAAKASAKLKRFQLSNPQNFVAHLVGGAVCGGASQVQTYIDSDDIVVEFDGAFLGEAELDGLLDSTFDPHAPQRLRELCVALNAAQSLKPLSLVVESWNGQRGYHLDVVADGQVSLMETSPFAASDRTGHRIAFKDRPSLKVVRRYLNSLETHHPELDVLRERCGMTSVPVLHQGEDCREMPLAESGRYLLWEHPEHPLGDWDLNELPGLSESSPGEFSALFLAGPRPALHVYVNGVAYSPPSNPDVLPCFCLVVCNTLGRDLSYTGITDDDQWRALVEELPQGIERLFTVCLGHYGETQGLRRYAQSLFLRRCLHSGFEKAAKHPIFPTVEGHYSTAQTLMQFGQLLFTERNWTHPLRSGESVYRLTPEDRDYLARSPDGDVSLVQADPQLRLSQLYFTRRGEWLDADPLKELKLHKPYGPVRELAKIQGQLGLKRGLGEARVQPCALGRPLPAFTDSTLPRGLQVILNHDRLETDDLWTHVVQDSALEEAMAAVKDQLSAFYSRLVQQGPKYNKHILHYLLTRKRAGKDWRGLLHRMEFRMLDNSTRNWQQLNQNRTLGETFRSHWLKAVHLPYQQQRLLRELFS